MIHKKMLLGILMCMALIRSVHPQNRYMVHGDVQGLDNEKLMVLKTEGDDFKIEIISVENNTFQFSGEIAEPFWVQLLLVKNGSDAETEGKLTEFLIEPSEIYVVGCSKRFSDVKVYGSKADKVLKMYFKKDEELSEKWLSLKRERDEFLAQKDSLNAYKIKKQLNAIILEERVPLLKSYVRENSDNIVGALLPFFCTLKNAMTENDYIEIYNLLSEDIQKTGFGRNIKNTITEYKKKQ